MARQVIFLQGDRIYSALLPWVIGVMVFLSGLVLVAGLQLASIAGEWRATLSQSLTIQIMEADTKRQEGEVQAAASLLTNTPGVAVVTVLSPDDTRALLEPWLGSEIVADDLPIPRMIDVVLDPETAIDVKALAAKIVAVAPSARVDSHEHWLGDLLSLAVAAQWISAAIIAFVVLATIAIVVFATRASLAAQEDTVEIVHMMGAKDAMIAKAFQNRFLVVGVRGGLIGVALVAFVFLVLYGISLNINSAYLPGITADIGTFIALAILPPAAGILTMATARYTVMRALMTML